jgi:hypothetical protein
LIGWTNLWIDGRTVVSPEMNRRRALIVLGKIDEILAWEQTKEHERDERFVELGQYLCEVRAGQYWRLENLKSFDEFSRSDSPNLAEKLITYSRFMSISPECRSSNFAKWAGRRHENW